MYYGKIKKNDITNGPGLRTSIYVSGCRNKCSGCFNKETWDFCYGKEFTSATMDELITCSKPDYIKGITLLGGEPLEPENQECVLEIIKTFKSFYPHKDIWLFSGYMLDNQINKWISNLPYTKDIIKNIDVLVDGKFIESLKDMKLGFRGSSNQRIIDMKKTIEKGSIVLHDEHYKKEKKEWK